jgi:phenylalanyl-tRNA synthetase beta chain
MWEYGQPLHAFDASCVEGGQIIVRRACKGEELVTLDGQARSLREAMLVIADANRPVAVAGVMGGANSEITDTTQTIIIESANFNGPSVRRTAIALGMRTDASSRFEKGLDAENVIPALNRVCELIETLRCGVIFDGIIDVNCIHEPARTIALEPDKIRDLLGCDSIVLSNDTISNMLQMLGFAINGNIATIPSWRGDVTRTVDLTEEIARLYGYDKLPSTLPYMRNQPVVFTDAQKLRRTLTGAARMLGFDECMSYSFLSPQDYDRVNLPEGQRASLRILNPLGEDRSIMRTTALPGLLAALAHNVNQHTPAVMLYELASTYHPLTSSQLADERQVLMLGAYGGTDFFTLKGDVEAILAQCRVSAEAVFAQNPSYHPGRCADLMCGDTRIGRFGQIHPEVAERYGVSVPLYAAELWVCAILESAAPEARYVPLPRYPAVTRDLALLCNRNLPAGALAQTMRHAAGPLLQDVAVFDVYTGAQVAANSKSVAFALTLRDNTRTLTDADVDAVITRVLSALEQEHGAVLRR